MATYDTPIFTQQSNKLVSAVAANSEQLTFTKIVYSSDDFSNKSDDDIANLTDLTNKEITATAQSFPENGITKVRGAGNNDNLDQGLNIKTFGLYAKGNSIPEMLVAVATSQNADYLDVHNNNASNQLTYTFNLKISNTQNINFSNIHDVSVTQSDLQSAIANIDLSEYAKKDDLNNLKETINQNISGPNSTVSQNINAMGKQANDYTDTKVKTLDTQTSQGINNLGQQIGQLIDIGKFRDEFNGKLSDYAKADDNSDFTGIKNFKNGLKIEDKQLSIQDDHLYYDGKSVLIATAPNAPKLKLTFNTSNGNIGYSLSSSSIDGGASVTKYNLFYKKDSDSDWNSKVIDATNANGEIAVNSNSNYDFKASASNYAGTSDTSDTQTILTMDSNIYGASWNQSVSSVLTRTDAAVGMVAGINGDRNDFDNTGIWGAMHRVQDDKGNVFVRIPKFYIKKTQTPGLSTWQVSLVKHDDSWYLPKCFWNFSSNQELPYVDVGAYLADLNGSVLESKVNTSPVGSKTIGNFRTYAHNNGSGYQQLDIHVWDVLQVLFIIEFATLDSQSVMYGNAEYYNSGYTDGMKGSSAGDSNNVKYRGIESMYCNIFQFVDGIGINAGSIYVCDDANNYSDSQFSYPYKPVSYRLPESGGYMQSAGLDLSNPEVTLPTSTTSTQGYYNDYCWNDSGSNYMMYAGGNGSSSGYGLFYACVYNVFSYSNSLVGCRLIKKPVL